MRERAAHLEIFRGVRENLLCDLIERSEIRTVQADEVVIEQGVAQASMYLVLEGALDVHLGAVDDEPVAQIGPGESVGEMSVLDPGPASAWVVASEQSTLMVMDESLAWAVTRASHEFCLTLLRKLTARMRNNNATVERSTRQRRKAEREAMVDELTRVPNRRWLNLELEELFVDKTRGLSVAVIDVDHFKRVNDTLGHQTGDAVLSDVAQVLAAEIRPADSVARWGGEEFVVVLPDTYLEGAYAAAERLRKAVAAAVIRRDDGGTTSVTVSIGIATRSAGMDPEQVIARADEALYEAKQGGRNRVCVAAPIPVLRRAA